jgi:hypothetical protein
VFKRCELSYRRRDACFAVGARSEKVKASAKSDNSFELCRDIFSIAPIRGQ